MNNADLAQVFANIGDLLEIKGENKFKIIAYRRAAETLREYNREVQAVWQEGGLRDIPGVGQAIADKIDELLTTGQLGMYERLKQEIPAGLIEVMAVPDLGPKKAALFWKELDITSVPALTGMTGTLRSRMVERCTSSSWISRVCSSERACASFKASCRALVRSFTVVSSEARMLCSSASRSSELASALRSTLLKRSSRIVSKELTATKKPRTMPTGWFASKLLFVCPGVLGSILKYPAIGGVCSSSAAIIITTTILSAVVASSRRRPPSKPAIAIGI